MSPNLDDARVEPASPARLFGSSFVDGTGRLGRMRSTVQATGCSQAIGVGGDRGGDTPGPVDRELPGREPVQAGVLGAADPVR